MNGLTPEQFRVFYNRLPRYLKKVARSFPPGEYRIKSGAPYSISCPGTIVGLVSYINYREVRVVVEAKNKLPKAIKHEEILGVKHNKSRQEIEKFHKSDTLVVVELIWLERIPELEKNYLQYKLF